MFMALGKLDCMPDIPYMLTVSLEMLPDCPLPWIWALT